MGLNRNLGNLTEVIKEGSGLIGMGLTPAPGSQYKLDVVGSIRSKYAVNGSNISLQPDSPQVYLVASSSDSAYGDKKLVINSSGLSLRAMGTSTAAMEILSSGNVGIGTTSIGNPLTVYGNSGNTILLLRNTASASGNYFQLGPDSSNNFLVYNHNNTGVYLSNGATSWTANSDERLKDINYKIENVVDKLCTLNAVSFSWKKDESKKEVFGLIAQDVEKVFPQIIDKNTLPKSENDDIEYLGVRYQELIPVLISAIQELKAEIQILKN